jgi:UDP-N-acetyl-D-mannosaminuronic acid transferase (WecB/TagA/CpsF family)
MCELVVTNERICKFYENNPAINFEAVNLIFIDLFDKILSDVNSTMNATINAQILSDVNKNTQMIRELNSSITFLKDSMGLKFTDIKKEYVDGAFMN